jgi:hypothetical protein
MVRVDEAIPQRIEVQELRGKSRFAALQAKQAFPLELVALLAACLSLRGEV